MSISERFIRRPIATSLLMAGIVAIGAAAYPLLPIAPLPQVDFPTIQVSAQLPGGSPETMASSVARFTGRSAAVWAASSSNRANASSACSSENHS